MKQKMERRKSREVKIGKLIVGGKNPICVQSMTKTKTWDVKATVKQIKLLEDAGCEVVRVAVLNKADTGVLGEIKRKIKIPLVADIHFNYTLAIMAMEQGVDKVRINPGNIGGKDKLAEIVKKAKDKGVSIRIGVNSGSLENDLLEKYGYPTSQAMVESALRWIEYLESLGFYETIISIKSTDVQTTIANYRLLAEKCDYPLHLGVTEAGMPPYGITKSAIGIGTLLLEGIGDTIRVSLTDDPVIEVKTAFDILKATGVRITSPEIVSCPQCGRIQIDLEKVVKEVTEKVAGSRKPIRISILGCAVNGPGEAKEADIGLAGGGGEGIIFRKGKIVQKVKENKMVNALIKEINKDE
jgi:(E)-4-hydroxy-3-methylbut-2-enyl-diphosphate synthase